MDFKDLEYFAAIARCGNITRAAQQLYVSQPTLSKFLQKLEGDTGLVLFQRAGRRLELTYAGQRYLAHAERLLSQKREMDAELTDLLRADTGVLHVGMPPFRCSFSLPEVLPVFRAQFPQVQFRIEEAPSAELDHKLLEGEIDLAFLYEPCPASRPELPGAAPGPDVRRVRQGTPAGAGCRPGGQLCLGVAGGADPAAAEPDPAAGPVYFAGAAEPPPASGRNSGKQQHPGSRGAGRQRVRHRLPERRAAGTPEQRGAVQRVSAPGLHPPAGVGGSLAGRELSARYALAFIERMEQLENQKCNNSATKVH